MTESKETARNVAAAHVTHAVEVFPANKLTDDGTSVRVNSTNRGEGANNKNNISFLKKFFEIMTQGPRLFHENCEEKNQSNKYYFNITITRRGKLT